jgi:hypothetical protein
METLRLEGAKINTEVGSDERDQRSTVGEVYKADVSRGITGYAGGSGVIVVIHLFGTAAKDWMIKRA